MPVVLMSCCCEPNSRLAWAADQQASRTASLGDDEYASLVYLSGVDHEGGQQGGDLEFEGGQLLSGEVDEEDEGDECVVVLALEASRPDLLPADERDEIATGREPSGTPTTGKQSCRQQDGLSQRLVKPQ